MASWTLEEIKGCEFPGGYSPSGTAGDCIFDGEAARKALEFFERHCRHAEGRCAGSRIALEPWQANIIGSAFGWKRPNGRRRYTQVPVFVARKNGKSTIGAGLALKHLVADGEKGGEVYSAAGDRLQAGIIHRKASSMVHADRQLLRLCRPMRNVIEVPKTNSRYRALSADAKLQHGLNPSAIMFDELHVQPNRDLWDALLTGTGSREQPITWTFTTAGFDRETICYEVYSHACAVRDGIVDDKSLLPAIWETTEADDWTSPAAWAKANPNLGVSVHEAWIAQQCLAAQNTPSQENTFRQLILNQWTQQAERWLPMHHWDETKGTAYTEEQLAGSPCFLGLDLSATADMTAIVAVFAVPGGFATVCRYFLPEKAVERATTMQSVYREWVRRGYLTLTTGRTVDQDAIRKAVNDMARKFDVRAVAFDPWNATQLQQQLGDEDGLTMIECRQGHYSLNEPSKFLEKIVFDGTLFHSGHPILRWNAANAVVKRQENGNIKPDKSKATGKIDGIVAMIMALSRVVLEGRSSIEPRGGDVGIYRL